MQVVQNLNDVLKALKEYGEAQKEKHRQVGMVDFTHNNVLTAVFCLIYCSAVTVSL